MAKFIWQAGVFTDAPLFAADTATEITVIDTANDSLASLWKDEAGTQPLSNPHFLGEPGHIVFYVNPGKYSITAENGAFVQTWENEIVVDPDAGGGGGASWGSITGTLSDQTDLQAALDSKAGTSQVDGLAGYIGTAADQDYTVGLQMPFAGAITSTTTQSASGSCTATFKVNSTALGGTANSVSTSEQEQAHASANSFSAGDNLVLTVSSNSSCLGLSFMIKFTRTLA